MSWLRPPLCLHHRVCRVAGTDLRFNRKRLHSTSNIPKTPCLPSWNVENFRREAFHAQKPWRLPRDMENTPPACALWFVHNRDPDFNLEHVSGAAPTASELHEPFWRQFEDIQVPLELTTSSDSAETPSFQRGNAPLKVLLTHLSSGTSITNHSEHPTTVYLAQCPLPSLPQELRDTVPTPELVKAAGRGDVYDSSLWLGRPPTYTPLHRDPNPNLFMQLSGRKIVRLLPRDIGDAVFQRVQEAVRGQGHAGLRGEEMMVGEERRILEEGVWSATTDQVTDSTVHEINAVVQRYGQEAELGLGEGLFIPKGWWHSVKSIGDGVSASVNWWFR